MYQARLTERLGYEVVFTSGFGISASTLGRPDLGFPTATEMLWSVGRIAQSVNIPLVADVDTGYGNPLNVMRTVSDLVTLGVGGIILEDQEWPKKCGHFEDKRVISKEEHVEKIRPAVDARSDSVLIIIAHTDSRRELGLGEAIRRGEAYLEAGADIIFIEAPESLNELREIADAFPGVPLFANMVEGGKTPILSAEELQEIGFKIAVFPLSGLFAATRAIEVFFSYLKENGTTAGFTDTFSFKEFEMLIEVPKYHELEKTFKLLSQDSSPD